MELHDRRRAGRDHEQPPGIPTPGVSGFELPSRSAAPGWLRWAWAGVLALLLAAALGNRLGAPPLFGDEAARAEVAREALERGDWVVPRYQGVPFLTRPPVQSWVLSAASVLAGGFTRTALRAPSAVATLLAALVLLFAAWRVLGAAGACTAALAYPTMAQVAEVGRLGETEALFAALLGSALVVWYTGYRKHGGTLGVWVSSYALVALATLTKGAQAPVYFMGGVLLYLLWRGEGKVLLDRRHLAGVAVLLAGVAAWQVPFVLRLGWRATWALWTGEALLRFVDVSPGAVVGHLLSFPVELVGCMLPWCGLVLLAAVPAVRRELGAAADTFAFAASVLAVAFPTCWLPPQAHTRYLIPVYSMVALAAGAMVEAYLSSARDGALVRGVRALARVMSVVMAALGLGLLGISIATTPERVPLALPTWAATLFAVTALTCAGVLWASSRRRTLAWSLAGSTAVAVFMACAVGGVNVSRQLVLRSDCGAEVATLVRSLPEGHRIVTIGPGHPCLVFYHPRPVERVDDWRSPLLAEPLTYFAVTLKSPALPTIPVVWEQTARAPLCAYRNGTRCEWLLVGRRLR